MDLRVRNLLVLLRQREQHIVDRGATTLGQLVVEDEVDVFRYLSSK